MKEKATPFLSWPASSVWNMSVRAGAAASVLDLKMKAAIEDGGVAR